MKLIYGVNILKINEYTKYSLVCTYQLEFKSAFLLLITFLFFYWVKYFSTGTYYKSASLNKYIIIIFNSCVIKLVSINSLYCILLDYNPRFKTKNSLIYLIEISIIVRPNIIDLWNM